MSFVSTAIDTLGGLASAIAPLATPAITAALTPPIRFNPVAPQPFVGGPIAGSIGRGALGVALGAGLGQMGDPSGGLRSPFGSSFCVEPTMTATGRLSFPHQVQFMTGPGKVETYVRAPKSQWKVVRRTKRRCRTGGR